MTKKDYEAIARALDVLLTLAEVDCLDDKSNVWRSAMIDARAARVRVHVRKAHLKETP